MSLGNSRPRNWGKEEQQLALEITCLRNSVTYRTRPHNDGKALFLAASRDGLTLPFTDCCAILVNTRRAHWEARSLFDDRILATGCTERDVVRATIQAVWQ